MQLIDNLPKGGRDRRELGAQGLIITAMEHPAPTLRLQNCNRTPSASSKYSDAAFTSISYHSVVSDLYGYAPSTGNSTI